MSNEKNVKRGFTRQNFRQKISGGFTLIELLVVIAIIGLLSSVVLSSLNSAREKARDARRLSDLRQINTAIQFYYDKFGFYPKCGTVTITGTDCFSNELKNNNFMVQVPTDPSYPQKQYQYYDSGGTRYALRVLWFESQPLARTGSYPNGTTCQSSQYPTCNWYDSCVYVAGSSCTIMSQVYGSE
ncbi:MAG: type II secretion system protein [bacterium]|nr:type II secretion system protein [bacterium]